MLSFFYCLTPQGIPPLITTILNSVRKSYKSFKVHHWLKEKSGGHVAVSIVNMFRELKAIVNEGLAFALFSP